MTLRRYIEKSNYNLDKTITKVKNLELKKELIKRKINILWVN